MPRVGHVKKSGEKFDSSNANAGGRGAEEAELVSSGAFSPPATDSIKLLQTLTASLLSVAALATVSPVQADTTQARCDVFPKGEDRATSSGLCSFSQRQGFVSIQLKNGTRIELKPSESTPNAFLDAQGKPALREILESNRGHVYRLSNQSIFVFWDTAPYK